MAFLLSSLVLAWVTLVPLYFVIVASGARRLIGPVRLPTGSRIAMVVTKAPSEPFEVVTRTLKGMLAQDVDHDTWLADEAPTQEMQRWCETHGVRISTRLGRDDYHRAAWPRRTRCKEGNLAFFYDHYGYDNYDFVAQLDADHVPEPTYLREILRPFADPKVGYVSAPSICDANATESWAARGRLYVEAPLHGIMQAGYNNGWAPLCIGSHYAVRTAALRDIGGLGPELAEDHSTTLMMNAHGWQGVHALDAIAHGDGPRTFADLITQEFQWSRSLVTILLLYTPKYFSRLSPRLKIQFLFCQLWYPLFAVTMTLMFATPIMALAAGTNLVAVTYPDFLLHAAPAWLIVMVMWFRWRSSGSYRPIKAKVVSWEALAFMLTRWPWVLAGTIMAVRDWLLGSFVDFRITPKGGDRAEPLPLRVLTPYVLIVALSIGSALMISDAGSARGFYLLTTINALAYVAVLLAIVLAHAWENGIIRHLRSARTLLQLGMAVAMIAPLSLAFHSHGLQGLQGLSFGTGRLSLVRATYRIAGAGQGSGQETLVFKPTWRS
jgi:cellulose synthase/poly-beta-1,6-N-acetylglucosamine synthase-like glycosyltransferase